ncbi:phosphopentomutase [Desulfosporosinus orientis DSM 765]|uniref:Phosphopentomutase n=1 Tax=Desulfosporosinus orientis (strain ATCC 19365 / DSM 765 / NCIMB 8382 / VKM B-1628 / Singapore I) TaxID=768706 RepID=G7W894_DESOD|nr:phosphopentomutase [Desulfosporosinus orientis]AET66740.1 phosphopentomutase [Desulfosporosinus orientis DSM 765]
MSRRVILIVLDSVGIGEMPDSKSYGDSGSNTLANIARQKGGLYLPHLQKLGLGNIHSIAGVPPALSPEGCFGKMAEKSAGKDTTSGHWEIAGLILDKAMPTFPQGFPAEFIEHYEAAIERQVIGNEVASGTEIIQRLGEEHVRTGRPIVYTSADSVFQVAAHEEIIPLPELMRICQIAREMLTGELQVGRVIARPFLGRPGEFYRTSNRHDFALEPPRKILLEYIREQGLEVCAVGKINDIYAGRGVTDYCHTKGNMEGVDKTLDYMAKAESGLIMTNLVDFDMLYGHRNDVAGYARALEDFDARLPELYAALGSEDMLVITADHGCDPTMPGTDHSREYVPLLVFGQDLQGGVNLGVRSTFADLGATVAEYLNTKPINNGKSFYRDLK